MTDYRTTEPYRTGVAAAVATRIEPDPDACPSPGSHAPMPCGCCWHELGHGTTSAAGAVCPKVAA